MAARVTKQFLQNVLQDAPTVVAALSASTAKTGLLASLSKNAALAAQATKKKAKQPTHESKKVRAKKSTAAALASEKKRKAKERFLDAAKNEQEHADRTRENVRKLKVQPTDKSKRLMTKALAMRKKSLY
uniref:Uncharacterized protein n=1 Tax=Globisporangium ultimum (strain ATCC 200006 / CBS 805.95 / DAOM BR144) TaxID=431595 RepID=K3WXW4_GLOUD